MSRVPDETSERPSAAPVLVTGATGFVGRHLCLALEASGQSLVRVDRTRKEPRPATSADNSVEVLPLELPDPIRTRQILEQQRPRVVVHLAALSSPRQCEASPELARRVNVEGTQSIVEAIQSLDFDCRLIYISSSMVYGRGDESCPITEETPCRPVSVYGQTKLEAETIVQSLGNSLIMRPFNHFGPGQRDDFAIPSFARQIAEIELGRREARLEVGDLEVKRDFLDVRDVVSAYRRAIESIDLRGIYNLSSGRAVQLRAIVEELRAIAEKSFEVVVRQDRVRPGEPREIVGSNQRLASALDWRPELTRKQSLRDLLDYWRERLVESG